MRTNSYRLDNQLASRATSHAGTEQLGTYSYSWDANKNKTAETIGAQGSGFGFSVPAGGYDQEDRLTAWNRTDGAPASDGPNQPIRLISLSNRDKPSIIPSNEPGSLKYISRIAS